MTTIIPLDQWPAWADRHCWDRDGSGRFYGQWAAQGVWKSVWSWSNIPMPDGWDWRVPMMRPSAEVKGGEQIADIVADWHAGVCGPHKAMMRIKEHLDALTFQPGNDLHIGYEAGMKLAKSAAPVAVVVDQDTAYSAYPYGIKKLGDATHLRAGTLLYTAPQPAQAIDLEQFREAVLVARSYYAEMAGDIHDPTHNDVSDCDRLLALIDGQKAAPPAPAFTDDAVVWVNRCNKTVPEALRYLANHPRPAGGEVRFNAAHLFQLADEIEHMASTPLYAVPMLPTKGEGE